jgi:hypothetical protein
MNGKWHGRAGPAARARFRAVLTALTGRSTQDRSPTAIPLTFVL